MPVVGIGASAGGLEAFIEFLKALPPDTGMGFVLIQHLEPHYESQLAEILSRSTKMPVDRAKEGQRVEPNHVYVIPPNSVMEIRNGELHLAPREESEKPHYPLDIFLESLAEDLGENAIGVVLSGSASDGAQGIRAIKSRLGTTFCQDEQSAQYSGMPHSAIATGAVDFVLPPAQIAAELARIDSHPFLTTPVENLEDRMSLAEEDGEFDEILNRLRIATKVDFKDYKHSTLRRRLGRRLALHHFRTLGEYLGYLNTHPEEIHDFYRDILISVTSFFREPEMFEALARILPQYLQTRANDEPFRIWVPGCATGEEVYSLAILISEVLETTNKSVALQVFGTDISESAIDRARSGIYAMDVVAGIPAERVRRFFSQTDSSFRIKQQVRESCVFARHDLTSDPPFSQMDLVSCRNVFIYLSSALQQRVLPTLHYSLKPGGMLILGSAESVGNRSDLFGVIDNENRIYSKKAVPARLSVDHLKPTDTSVVSPPPRPRSAIPFPAAMDLENRSARILRDLYAPAGVLINDDMQVVHFHGQMGLYLDQVPGDASANLLRLAPESLVSPLRKVVAAAFDQKQPTHESGIVLDRGDSRRYIKISAVPIANEAHFALVLFEDEPPPDGSLRAPRERTDQQTSSELQLGYAQRELAQLRDYLQKVMEQHEATTEELRAANEEARSTNEELQSTNEELRTAKEQIQSANEELVTVNAELKHRNLELNQTGNDLSNILSAATIPILMVGMDLRLRRFTPAAERLLKMTPEDIGRGIGDIRYAILLPFLKDMLVSTLETLNLQQRRVQDQEGRWYDVFVRPYRTIDDRIEGAVVTFIDIDDATRALDQAELARDFADGIVETVQHPLLILDANLRVVRATGAFYRTFSVSPAETLGQFVDDLGNGQWKVPELRRLLEQAFVRDVPFRDLEISHEFPHIGLRTMRLNARRISVAGPSDGVLLAIEDITERQEAAEIQYRRLFETAKDGILVLEAPTGLVVDVNPYLLEMARHSKADLLNRPFWEIPLFLDAQEVRGLVPAVVVQGTMHYDSAPLRARDGRELFVDIIASGYRVKDRSLIQLNIRDVTEKKRSEEDLRRSNLDLQQFAFAASHDLQEPLRTMTSFLELFQHQNEGKLGPQADEQIHFITGAADEDAATGTRSFGILASGQRGTEPFGGQLRGGAVNRFVESPTRRREQPRPDYVRFSSAGLGG